MNSVLDEVRRHFIQRIELSLVTRIEEIEGRVASNEEVARYAHRVIYPDGVSLYTWKGQPIVRVIPPSFRQDSAIIGEVIELRPA